ncbi:sulfatase/phosphatase domain-containing protein [Zobellia uliginosa]|uniref:sulfatase/phosphatase domain-containing protein n=1 Tax=Zobellia uliginosa TaxID=143224 RepID=UPI001C073666|nr:sulfatase/phosphatase domain-containing protein [Zobellia uliginosa]MBU2945383.1 DUF4976 domain-containing protein [Zobellia uliginosa]
MDKKVRIKDPQELNNVFDDPDYSEIVTELKQKLVELRKKYKDFPELDQEYIDIYKEMNAEKENDFW